MNRLLSYLIQGIKSWQKHSPQLAITTYVVLSIHVLLIAFCLAEKQLPKKKKETLTVHTVSLQPKKQPAALLASVAPIPPVIIEAPVTTPEEPSAAPKVTESPPPPAEKEKPKPKKESPPKPKEDKKAPAPKPKSEAPPKPKKEIKPEKPKEEKPKKETPPPPKPKKEQPPKKQEPATPKECAKKETPKKETKETASPKESPPKKSASETSQKQKERTAEHEKLLAEALASLDQAASTKSSTSASSSKTAVAPLLAPPGALSGESLEAAQREYKDALAYYLKQTLKLPEYGPVKIELLVRREGTVARLKILSSESTLNRHYVESNLPTQRLPPFGTSFPGEKEQTFVLTLTNQ